MGPLQHLQKAQLQLIRPAGINIIEGALKAFHVLQRKPGDQIQVDVDVPPFPDFSHNFLQPLPVSHAPDLLQGIRISGLHADFQLYQAGTKAAKQRQLFLCQNIRRDLKMEIGDTVVMLPDIAPDFHGMGMAAVKGTVHKLDLRYLFVQEKLKLLLDQFHIPKTHRFVNGGQTIAAPVRAAAAGFVIDDAILKIGDSILLPVKEGNLIESHSLPPRRSSHNAARLGAVSNATDLIRQGPGGSFFRAVGSFHENPGGFCRKFRCGRQRVRIQIYQLPEGFFPFSDHDARRRWQSGKGFLRVVRYLRPAQPDRNMRQNLGKLADQTEYHLPVPDITRKADRIGIFPVKVGKNLPEGLVDGILCNFDVCLRSAARRYRISGRHCAETFRIGAQAVDGRIGVYVFGVDGCEEEAHGVQLILSAYFHKISLFLSSVYPNPPALSTWHEKSVAHKKVPPNR